RSQAWHAMPIEEVLSRLNSSENGLSHDEVNRRLEQFGFNTLPVQEPPGLLKVFLLQFLHPLIYILLAAAVASLVIGEVVDAAFIMIVILLNSSLGAYQEWNAERSAAALQKLINVKVRVKRDGKELEISSKELVPGDVVLLESGNKIAADLRLISAAGLTVDESFLTGESIAAEKKAGKIAADHGVSERSNMCFAGASVLSGRGMAIVVATGLHTQVGEIAQNVSLAEATKPPLIIRMEKFTKQISYLVISIAAVLAGLLIYKQYAVHDVFFFVVALAVSAIPEGLPVALTVALSIATSRMSKRHVIVRRLSAVESLGSCTVIASDKTGTLTVNQQTVRQVELPDGPVFSVSGEGYNGVGVVEPANELAKSAEAMRRLHQLVEVSILANEGHLEQQDLEWRHHGDAMDVALLALGYKVQQNPTDVRQSIRQVGAIPYESERKFSAAFYQKNGTVFIGVKGAVETLLNLATTMNVSEGMAPIAREQIQHQENRLAAEGYRVLAVATAELHNFVPKEDYDLNDIPKLNLLGLVAFIDPLRPEVIEAVDKSHAAGIDVLMITGDHPATAASIGKKLHIISSDHEVVTGAQLDEAWTKGEAEFDRLVYSARVFARVSPVQKKNIVDSLRRKGEFVAVTGDGVNDAPAMRSANIGVAMGSGTDVARETSSMIITDDNFSSIVAGVEEGRFAYDNVRKVILLLISTGAAEVIFFLLAIIFNLPLPLLAVQILWLNLVTNGIQDVALAFEGGEPEAMKRKPRKPTEKIFNPLMVQQIAISGLTIGLIVFGFWFYLINYLNMEETAARNLVLLLMVFMQNVHVFNCRSEHASAFRVPLKRNVMLIFGVLLAAGFHILSMHLTFMQQILRVQPIPLLDMLRIFALALPVLLMMEIYKSIKFSR
ncbi:MAG: HAD-IC family P-type ATPase, partial [candidate division KSB1 bacterium]|nr:HAD-IC family P-type ATPase [candidate division KSB1 bacterium]